LAVASWWELSIEYHATTNQDGTERNETMTDQNNDSYDGRSHNIDQHETGEYPSDAKYGLAAITAQDHHSSGIFLATCIYTSHLAS
jgi:hypothetical protein